MNAIKHQFFDFLRLVGLRDRLRCPVCTAVGTWKPHGGWLDFDDKRRVRRWLCKWCGYYEGPEAEYRARILKPLEGYGGPPEGLWELASCSQEGDYFTLWDDASFTPRELIFQHTPFLASNAPWVG